MLNIRNLKAGYNQTLVLDGLNLNCQAGQIHGILGMNGAGKTTLFRSIYGFLKPVGGELSFNDQPLSFKDIGYLETENYFYPFIKAYEYLQVLATNTDEALIHKWNNLFDLPLDELVDNYSTGMKKKLAFMGILLLGRPILILDEPFNGVDIESNEKIIQILERLRASNKTILISSHIIQSLTKLSDTINYLNNAQIEKTYQRSEFGILEDKLTEMVKTKISKSLEELF